MTSEHIKDSGKSEDLDEDTWGLFNVCKSVSFWLLATVGTILLLREYRIYQSNLQLQQTRRIGMDDDLSHAAIARFEAIEARLDVLEGTEVQPVEEESESEAPSVSSRSRRSGRSSATVDESGVVSDVPEGGVA
jgi:hypothetical protein